MVNGDPTAGADPTTATGLPIPLPTRSSSGSTSVTPGLPYYKTDWAPQQLSIAERQRGALIGEGEGERLIPGPWPQEEEIPEEEVFGPPIPITKREQWAERKAAAEDRAMVLENKATRLEERAARSDETKSRKMLAGADKLRGQASEVKRKYELGVLQEKGLMGQKIAAKKKVEYRITDEIKQLGEEVSRLSGESKAEKTALGTYKKRLEDINKKVADTKIDPHRYVRNMPLWAKALHVLGAAMGGYAEGYTGGRLKNRAFDLLNAAINRDVAAQKANLENMMNQRNYTASERAFVYDKWRVLEKDRKIAVLRQSQKELAKIGLASDIAKIKIDTANEIDKIDSHISNVLLTAEEKARDVKRKSYTVSKGIKWHVPRVAKGAKLAGTPSPAAVSHWRGKMEALEVVKTTQEDLGKLKEYGHIARRLPNTEAEALRKQYLIPLAVSLRKARETGVMTEQDFQRYKAITDAVFISRDQLISRLKNIRRDIIKSGAATLRSYKGLYNIDPWKKQLQEELKMKKGPSAVIPPKGARKQKE